MITTSDQIAAALAHAATVWSVSKASLASAVAGQTFSKWRSAGNPGLANIPGSVEVPTKDTLGAMTFANPTAGQATYLARVAMANSNSATDVQFHDRLSHCGGLSGIVTTAQTANVDVSVATNNMAQRMGQTDFSEVQWGIEIYTALGATGVNALVNVTYGDNTSETLPAIALGATPRAGRIYPIMSNKPGQYIKRVNTVQLSASTGTAGNFGVVATNSCGTLPVPMANFPAMANWFDLGFPRIADDACLFIIVVPSTTSTGALNGVVKMIQG